MDRVPTRERIANREGGAYLRPARLSSGTTVRDFVCRKNSSLYGRPSSAGGLIAQKNRNVQVGHSCLFHTNQKLFPTRAMGPMRVARLINKRYNHNRKQNSTAAAGCYQHPTACSRRPNRPKQQKLCTAGILYPFRPPKARESSALHGTTIACAVLFCFQISFIRGDKKP